MFNKDSISKIKAVFAYGFVAYEVLMFALEKLEQVKAGNYQISTPDAKG